MNQVRTKINTESKYERRIDEKIMCICGLITSLPDLDEQRRQRVASVAKAIIRGNLKDLKTALAIYSENPEKLTEDHNVLSFAFRGEEVEVIPSMSAANLFLVLKGCNLVLSVSTHPEVNSRVCRTNADRSRLTATNEDPNMAAKRFAGAFSVPELSAPPSYLGRAV